MTVTAPHQRPMMRGLDLSRTKPPIENILNEFESIYPKTPILYVVEVHERLVPQSLAALQDRFEWSELNIYDLPMPIDRHSILFGTKRWQ